MAGCTFTEKVIKSDGQSIAAHGRNVLISAYFLNEVHPSFHTEGVVFPLLHGSTSTLPFIRPHGFVEQSIKGFNNHIKEIMRDNNGEADLL
ncbi:6785_t:CDS:2 [Ambispora gerdemannii]|uniref:6785_t:CDS:1 n=1 Tax=Ambispora gerdemannii TaxID=144530 RepID=A0A9N9CRU0_9GLOM|nr:6785_t:CDS:2 [Ambispora gerdemannii]